MAKKKIVVVGNCQARPIATFLTGLCDNVDVIKIAVVHLLNSEDEGEYQPYLEDADIIVAQLINDNYPCDFLRTSVLERKFSNKLVKIVNIFNRTMFKDWYPVKKGKINLLGPLDIYHNLNIYNSWKNGFPIDQAIETFEGSSNVDEKSISELIAREKNVDVKIADFLVGSEKPLFHTYNHPKNYVLIEYCCRILEFIGFNVGRDFIELESGYEALGRVSIPEEVRYTKNSKFIGFSYSLIDNEVIINKNKEYSTAELVKSFYEVYEMLTPGVCLEEVEGVEVINNVVRIGEQLFLYQKNTGQRQMDYFLGNRRLSKISREIFSNNVKVNIDLSKKHDFLYKHIVFPAKPVVFSSVFEKINLKVESLYSKSFDVDSDFLLYPDLDTSDYDAEDTHTNDKGVFEVIKTVLKSFGIVEEMIATYGVGEKLCDLAYMLGKKNSSYLKITGINICPDFNDYTKNFSLDEFLESNTGDLQYSVNEVAPFYKRIVLFGDSFFKTRIHIFSALFNEVVYIRNPYVIEDLVLTLQPDIVLTGNAERYLVNQPDVSKPRPYFMNYITHGMKKKPSAEVIRAFESLFSGRSSSFFKAFKNSISSQVAEDIKNKNTDAAATLTVQETKFDDLSDKCLIQPEENFYDRQDATVDNSNFGVECETYEIDPYSSDYDYRLSSVPYFGDVPNEKSKFCSEIKGHVYKTVCRLKEVDVFLPNGAVYNSQNNKILTPSLWQSRLFFNSMFRNDKSTKWKWRIDKNYASIPLKGKTLLLHNRAYTNYFHYVIDVVSKLELIDDISVYDNILVGTGNNHPFVKSYLEIYGVDIDKIVWVNGYEVYRCEELDTPYYKVTEDVGIRANYHGKEHYKGWCKEFFASIKSKVDSQLITDDTESSLPKKIFVSRRNDTSRKIVNFDDVNEFLESKGYVEIDPAKLSVNEQIQYFRNASDIVSVHGAAMTNIIWSNQDTSILELMPNDYDDPGYRMIAGLKNMESYRILFCKSINPNNTVFSDLEVDMSVLRGLLSD